MGAIRHAWERLGVVCRLVLFSIGWHQSIGAFIGRLPRVPRRLVGHPRRRLPRGLPGLDHPGRPGQRPGLPPRPSSIRVTRQVAFYILYENS